MKKVLLIISDDNKSKFISKGFSSAFKKLNFFVREIKTYDLNINEINAFLPDIIFTFWSNLKNNIELEKLFNQLAIKSDFIHCAELKDEIPKKLLKKKFHFFFSSNSSEKKHKYIQPISASDYIAVFKGFKYNITFTGNPSYSDREIILAELIKNFGTINLFCRPFDFYNSVDEIIKNKLLDNYQLEQYKKSYRGYVSSTNYLADIYISSKINIDLSNNKFISYRLLEVLASEGFIITPYNKEIIKQFDDGKEIETYKDIYELIDKINFYLKNPLIAKNIAINGKENAVSNFSYYDKLKSMLKVVYGKNFSS